MADFDLSTVTASLAQNYKDIVLKTFNSTSMLLRFLPWQQGEGKNVAWVVESTGAIGENFTDGQDVSNYGIDTPNAATLSWGMYRSNFKVTDLAASAAATSRSPQGLIKVMGNNLVNSARKLASTLNGVGYSGAGTGTTIAGLVNAIDDTNTYGGILRSGNAFFRSTVIDPGSATDPTIALIRSDVGSIQDACGEKPDLAFVSTAVWNKVANLFTDNRRFNQEVLMLGSGAQIAMDASVDAIVVDGVVFVKDKDATANKIYYVNSNYVHWEFLPVINGDELIEQGMDMPLMDEGGGLPLGMKVFPIARTGAARKITCEVQCQLVVEKPSACGVRRNVNA